MRSIPARNLLTKAAIASASVAGGLVFTGTASAHNIPVSAAQSKCTAYAQQVVDDDATPFTQAHIHAVAAFPGHNHYVRCTVSYDTRRTAPTKYYACIETIDAYYLPEGADRTNTIFMRHTSRPCGPTRLSGPRPG